MTKKSVPFLEVRDIVKRFGGVTALDSVSLCAYSGEVLCLAGENGSGKSTLIKIISGVQAKDSGTILIDGVPVESLDPKNAMTAGIQVIYQDFSIFPNLTVAENIAMTRTVTERRKFYNPDQATNIAQAVLDRLGLDLPLSSDVVDLSVADKQLTAICRALASEAKLVVMDEPTTALTQHEVGRLFKVVEKLTSEGVALIFVSHKLDEVMRIADRVSILRSGRNVIDSDASALTPTSITQYMTGRTFDQTRNIPEIRPDAKVVLELSQVGVARLLDDISFEIREGEILGLTGLLGSGRTEVAEVLFGVLPKDKGTIRVDGQQVSIDSINDAIAAGIGYVPEDRLTQGLFLEQSISNNVIAASIDQHTSKLHLLERKSIAETISHYFAKLKIKAPNVSAPVRSLSGGNAQRVVLAKWLARQPRVLILNGPTVGVDVGSKAEILDILRNEAKQGRAILVISDDAPEMVACCHRILVINGGRIVDELEGDAVDVDTVRAKVVE
jgi:simple sugar transport system ATP-binding protein